jgi:hypothetical protein
MSGRLTLLAVVLAAVLAIAAVAGFAFAADDLLGPVMFVEPSRSAGLLPPITVEGRVGWACEAERRARATSVDDAALPPAP